jgi:hypothetical protein
MLCVVKGDNIMKIARDPLILTYVVLQHSLETAHCVFRIRFNTTMFNGCTTSKSVSYINKRCYIGSPDKSGKRMKGVADFVGVRSSGRRVENIA